jgi:DNA polymerase-4
MSFYFHVDIDAFFASVEQYDHPEYAGKPVIVGALPGHRGVVSTCSYEARAFGVRSAMPISEAFARCPQGIFLPVRMDRYAEVSRHIMGIFRDSSPEVLQVSVDEAFLDASGTERLLGPPREQAARLKERVLKETGMRISIGAAGNRYVAKVASAASKPDGLIVVEPGGEAAFIRSLRLKDIWGLGAKGREALARAGIETIEELLEAPKRKLEAALGKAGSAFVLSALEGKDPGIYGGLAKSRSISAERTFERDVRDRVTLDALLLELSHDVMRRALDEGFGADTAFIKLRYADFSSTSAQRSLKRRIESAEELFAIGKELLDARMAPGAEVRLLGAGLSAKGDSGLPAQGELFESRYARARAVELAALELEKRGKGRLTKARLLGRGDRRASGTAPRGGPESAD